MSLNGNSPDKPDSHHTLSGVFAYLPLIPVKLLEPLEERG
jgi:hypothetical protein